MDIKLLFKAISIKMQNTKKRFKGTPLSYVSLFLIIVLIVTSSLAWFFQRNDSVSIQSQTFQMNGASGLHDDQLMTKQTKVTIPNFRLEEASSVDGRNIYFPSSFSDNASDASYTDSTDLNTLLTNIQTQTKGNGTTSNPGMRFREGNAGDKNVRYAYAGTKITASGVDTKVWLKGYKVEIGSNIYQDKIDMYYDNSSSTSGTKPTGMYFPNTCPVRIAIIDDSGHTPKVFDPSARIKDDKFVTNTYAIHSIDRYGKPTTTHTDLDAFSSYYYGTENPLFTVPAGTTIDLTVVAWLEGTHPYAENFEGQEMKVEIEVETNVSEMEMIYLHDWTVGDTDSDVTSSNWRSRTEGRYWVYNGDEPVAMQYYDNTSSKYKTTIMKKIGNRTYQAAIPKYITTQISFYRLNNTYNETNKITTNPNSQQIQQCPYGAVFNSWHTYSGVNSALNSSINNSNWKVLGDLQETRKIGNTNNTYTHYYMVRGNGYGVVSHTAANRFEQWLSPCIGYWGGASGI